MTIIETDPNFNEALVAGFSYHCGTETCVITLADYNEDEAVWGAKFLSFSE